MQRAATGLTAGDPAILSAAGFLYSAVRSNLFYWELVGFTLSSSKASS